MQPAPEQGFRRGRVKVITHSDHEDIREVVLGEGAEAWLAFARDTQFTLANSQFISIGEAVYRSETVDRIEPIEEGTGAVDEALQACMGILVVIRDAQVTGEQHVRYLCAQMLQTLETRGFVPDE